jgi:hypothetical protein
LFDTWLETQKGLVALCDTPQGFFRLGSVIWAVNGAGNGTSETRLVWTY